MATSAGISAVLPRASLSSIGSPSSPLGWSTLVSTASIRASAGASSTSACAKASSAGSRALHLDHDAVAVVEDESAELLALRDPVDEWPEADALDDPADDEGAALHRPDCCVCDTAAEQS